MNIVIAKDFSEVMGSENAEEGPFSGEHFYKNHLKPSIIKAKKTGEKVFIDFDNTWGYPPSFLRGSFGRLAEHFGKDVLKYIEVKSIEDESLIDEIKKHIEEGF